MSIQKAITQALSELDSLGDSAVRRKILGLGVEESPEEEKKEDEEEEDFDEAALIEALSK